MEPAPNTGQNMLKLNLKFENLEDVLERIQTQIGNHGGLIHDIQRQLLAKAGQTQLGKFFDWISTGVHKEIGEKAHKFKLDDSEFLKGDYAPDLLVLKKSVEGFIDKLDIIS